MLRIAYLRVEKQMNFPRDMIHNYGLIYQYVKIV